METNKLLKEAKKYKSRTKLHDNDRKLWGLLKKKRLLDIAFPRKTTGLAQGDLLTKKNCLKLAKKCKTRSEFKQRFVSAYRQCLSKGWQTQAFKYMIKKKSCPSEYNTIKKASKIAIRYSTRSEFRLASPGSYNFARKKNWLDRICKHMPYRPSPKRTKESVRRVAKKYKSRTDFQNKAKGDWSWAQANGHLDYVQQDIPLVMHLKNYWNKERCYFEALWYDHKSHFEKGSPSCYSTCLQKGWIDYVCSHMTPLGNKMKRAIYVYEFADNTVYVGLTGNLKRRKRKHISDKKQIYRKIEIEKLDFAYFELWEDYSLSGEKAEKIEKELFDEYSKEGYTCIFKPGGLGAFEKILSKTYCRKVSKTYSNLKNFRNNNNSVYQEISKQGWTDELCSHMKRSIKRSGTWSTKALTSEAKKYNRRNQFKKGNASAYRIAQQKGLLDRVCSHMDYVTKKQGYWTKQNIEQALKKAKSRDDFKVNFAGAYNSTVKKKLLHLIDKSFPRKIKPRNYWNKNTLAIEARKYKTRSEFQEKNSGAYTIASRLGIKDRICSHMASDRIPRGYLTKEKCRKLAESCKDKSEFSKAHNSAYHKSLRKKWIKEFFPNS